MADRLLFLVRHGKHDDPGTEPDDGPLNDTGRRQIGHLGPRLAELGLDALEHSPLRRAVQTADLLAAHLPGVPRNAQPLLTDCVPYVPPRETLLPQHIEFFDSYPPEHLTAGARQAEALIAHYARPVDGDTARRELLVTHNFVIGWLIRHALDAPPRRWMGLNQANCGLGAIRYTDDRPPALLAFNDVGHLPAELR